jgi:hypothetical protein
VQIWTLNDKQAIPSGERPPRKRMKKAKFQLSDVLLLSNMSRWLGSICFMLVFYY